MMADLHWSEGMFLGPHHFQSLQRRVGELCWAVADNGLPFAWGVRQLQINLGEVENYQFTLKRADVTFQDGTRLRYPGNVSIATRDFKNQLDKAGGQMDVYIVVPSYRPADANIAPDSVAGADRRWLVEQEETIDENTGKNPQPLLVRRLNARIFFTGEDIPRGFQTLRLATIRRGNTIGSPPVLAPERYPPLLEASNWPALKSLAGELVQQLEAKKRYLGERLAGRPVNFGTGSSVDFEALLKLHAINGYAPMFKQLVDTPHLHPYVLYVEMLRVAGGLSIFDSVRRMSRDDLPAYNHDDQGRCFSEVYLHILALLEKMVPMSFVVRPFAPIQGRPQQQFVQLTKELLEAGQDYFLAVRTAQPVELSRLKPEADKLKVGCAADIEGLRAARFPGLVLVPIERVPPELPVLEQAHYFRLTRDGSSAKYWYNVEAQKNIMLDHPEPQPWAAALYVVIKEPMRGRIQ